MPLDEEDEEDDEEDELLLLLLLLLDEELASPDEDELLDEEASPDEDELLLELDDELLLTLASVPPMPPIPLEDDDVPLAAPAPVAVTGSASLHAPPSVTAQIVTKPVQRASFLAESMVEMFVLEWCWLRMGTR